MSKTAEQWVEDAWDAAGEKFDGMSNLTHLRKSHQAYFMMGLAYAITHAFELGNVLPEDVLDAMDAHGNKLIAEGGYEND